MAFSFQPKTAGIDGLIFCVDAANTKSYPGSGTTVTNIGLTTSTASLVNGVTYNSSQGGSFFFDGSNDYISCGDNNFRISGPSLSMEVVFYHDGTNKTNMPIFAKRNNSSPFNMYSLGVNNGNPYTGGSGTTLLAFFRPDEYITEVKDRVATFLLPSAGIYHVFAVNDNTNLKLFVNGVLQTTATSSQSQNNFLISNADLRIGNNNSATYFTGSIYTAKLYNRTLSATEVLQNYNAICGRFGKTPTITDGDALSFVNAANISNETQQSAINTLVTDLKGAGLWSKMKAIYPFVGGTAASHKWNLKDPRDVDAAYRLQFNGGWTHSSTGAKANGTNGYANTYLSANTMGQNSVHLSVYIRENISGFMADIGHVGNSSQNTAALDIFTREGVLLPTTDSFTAYGLANQTNALVGIRAAVSTSAGHTMVTRTSSTLQSLYKNGLSIGTSTNSSVSPTSNIIYISALNFVALGTIDYYSSRQVALATIGDGLTDADASNLYTIVQKYQTTLGRQV